MNFLQALPATSFFYNLPDLQHIRFAAAVKLIESDGICSSGSFQPKQLREGMEKEQCPIISSSVMTPVSWFFGQYLSSYCELHLILGIISAP